MKETNTENQKETSPIIGKFKPKRKFLNFVTGLKGRVRFLRKEAFLKAEQLSGMLEGVIFKITLCDEGTIEFQETDTNLTDIEMVKRFITEIDERDVTGYQEKYVVSGLEFQDEDGKPCYLEVEYSKPIDQLFSIFQENNSQSISSLGLSILDNLLGDIDQEKIEVDPKESVIVTKKPLDDSNKKSDYLEEQFRKMNEDKVKELKERIESSEKECQKIRLDISQSEKKLNNIKDNLSVLQSRLDSFNPKQELNGYVFFVSDEQKPEDIGLTEDNRQIADKIADIMGLKKEVLFKMLTQGYYKIQIAEKTDIKSKEPKVANEIILSINSIINYDKSKDAKITTISPCIFEYRGTLTWHQIVDKMIKNGFEQDAEFDKHCGSNSYESIEKLDTNTDNN